MAFKKATKNNLFAKLCLSGPSGSGKTYSALLIAKGLGGTTAILDTGHFNHRSRNVFDNHLLGTHAGGFAVDGGVNVDDKALLTGSWWIILIPGVFLVVTLLCVTELGNYLRGSKSSRHGNL